MEDSYSNIERVNLRWLFWLAAATGGIWVLVTGLKIAQVSTAMRDGHVAIALAVLVYGIGYMGLRQPEVFRYQTEFPVQKREVESTPTAAEPETSRPRCSGRDSAMPKRCNSRRTLVGMMEREQLWKESELTLPDLASRVNSSPHKLSLVQTRRLGRRSMIS